MVKNTLVPLMFMLFVSLVLAKAVRLGTAIFLIAEPLRDVKKANIENIH
jgi:hypothetical protein